MGSDSALDVTDMTEVLPEARGARRGRQMTEEDFRPSRPPTLSGADEHEPQFFEGNPVESAAEGPLTGAGRPGRWSGPAVGSAGKRGRRGNRWAAQGVRTRRSAPDQTEGRGHGMLHGPGGSGACRFTAEQRSHRRGDRTHGIPVRDRFQPIRTMALETIARGKRMIRPMP